MVSLITNYEPVTASQKKFLRLMIYVFVDLIVLGLFSEFWDKIYIDSFSTILLSSIILQLLLRLANYFEKKIVNITKNLNIKSKVLSKVFLTWLLLFSSKVIMLEVIDFVFGDKVEFIGQLNGLVSFFVVVITMVASEIILRKVYFSFSK